MFSDAGAWFSGDGSCVLGLSAAQGHWAAVLLIWMGKFTCWSHGHAQGKMALDLSVVLLFTVTQHY